MKISIMNRIIFFALLLISCSSCQGAPPSESDDTQAAQAEAATTTEASVAEPGTDTAVLPKPEQMSVRTDNAKKPVSEPVMDAGVSNRPVKNAKKPPKTEKETATEVEKKAEVNEPEPTEPADGPPSHDAWNSLLQQYVNSKGNVNYAGFKSSQAKLQAYLDELAANPPQSSWPSSERLAYWINAYNAFTVKLIVDNYPLASITDLHGGKPWDVKWIKLGDKTYSLNNIENDIIRPRFKEARIHFAVNCAAASCPPLYNRAFTAGKLNTQLEQLTKKFVNNASYNEIGSQKVEISKIFDWYKADFSPSIIAFLNKYAATSISNDAKINFKEYDWSLNKQ
jgi:hypothetical protein